MLKASMSRKKAPGPALTIEESVPGRSRLIDVTNPPPSLLTVTPKARNRGLFVSSVEVMRNESPLTLNTGDCLSPLPPVVLTTLAPGHSKSGPGAFWSCRVEVVSGELSGALADALPGSLAGELAGALADALFGGVLAMGGALTSGVPWLGLPPSHCSTVMVY